MCGLYLAAWTLTWAHGGLPPHELALDALLCAGLGVMAWRLRPRTAPALPLLVVLTHLGIELGVISAPRTRLSWGLSLVSLGFCLLLGSLAASVLLRRPPPPPFLDVTEDE